jgi:hypothetical protein
MRIAMRTILLAILVLGGVAAQAALRTGGNYAVATDTVNAAGGRSASASYVNEGSLGGIGGVSTAPAPVEVARHGYVGQLYDATLQVTASPTNVNEGATRQLAAFQTLDDATTNALNPALVTWGILGGPVASIGSGGLLTAATVYQNSNAVVSGLFEASTAFVTLNVVNVSIDNWGSYAGDGLDDAWQVQYFGANNTNAAPARDPDGDGQNNVFEYTAGTTPTNAASKFALRILPGLAASQRRIVFNPRFPSRTYTVMYHTNAGDPPPLVTLGGISTADVGPERTVTDLNATVTNRFYKVRITYP